MTADPSTIRQGDTSVLTLRMPSTDYHNVMISGVRPSMTCDASSCTATLAVSPNKTTTYQSAAEDANGNAYAMPSATVTVTHR